MVVIVLLCCCNEHCTCILAVTENSSNNNNNNTRIGMRTWGPKCTLATSGHCGLSISGTDRQVDGQTDSRPLLYAFRNANCSQCCLYNNCKSATRYTVNIYIKDIHTYNNNHRFTAIIQVNLRQNFVGAEFYCPHFLADGNQRIRITEKTLEFSLTVLSTLSPYLVMYIKSAVQIYTSDYEENGVHWKLKSSQTFQENIKYCVYLLSFRPVQANGSL